MQVLLGVSKGLLSGHLQVIDFMSSLRPVGQ